MNVFISQPIRGRTDEEILEERKKIVDCVKALHPNEKVVEINSFFSKDIESKNMPLRMLGMSIELLAEADVAVFASDWCVARGCKIEHECAQEYGVEILDLD